MSDYHQEQQEIEEDKQANAARIFAYLEPHIAPRDIEMVLWYFNLPIPVQPRDYPQMPLGWGEGN